MRSCAVNGKNRIKRLLEWGRQLRGERRLAATMRRCRGRPLSEIVGEVEAACPPECLPLLEEVFERMLAFEETQEAIAEQGGKREMCHPFLRWLWLLEMGAASLPETLPEIVVRLWHRGSPPNPEVNPCHIIWSECIPWQRCEACLFVVPDGDRNWKTCPVCNCERMCWDFCGEFGVYHYFDKSKGLDRSGRMAR